MVTDDLLNADELITTSPVAFQVREVVGMESVISITRAENLSLCEMKLNQ